VPLHAANCARSGVKEIAMSDRLSRAFAAIDAANAADPTLEDGQPTALLYGLRMTAEIPKLFPNASDILQIAARGQHIERWLLPRTDYPDGLPGYLDWRREQARRHAARVGQIMLDAGYTAEDAARVGVLLRKESIKRDADVQALEDVICFAFLRYYFADFAVDKEPEHLLKIVQKTARKMSAEGRTKAVVEFKLQEPFAALFCD
jgi:hypothetical protein